VLINNGDVNLALTGTNFYPQSIIQLNGLALQTTFVDNSSLQAVIPGTALTSLGEQQLLVVNPIPGGRTSASIRITPYQTILINPRAIASVPATGMIYAAISSGAPQNPNTVIPVNPSTGAVGTPIPVMTNPQFLAASGDGSYLFVAAGYNGTSAFTVDRINLGTGAVDRTFPFPPNPDCSTCSLLPATDLKAVPGQPTEVLLAQGDVLALYNDSGLVNYVPSGPNYYAEPQFDNLAILPSSLAVYALPFTIFQNPFFNDAQITASGLTYTTITGSNYGQPNNGNQVITDGTLLYTNNGQIWNPSTQLQVGSLSIDPTESPAITLDTTAGELYAAGSTSYLLARDFLRIPHLFEIWGTRTQIDELDEMWATRQHRDQGERNGGLSCAADQTQKSHSKASSSSTRKPLKKIAVKTLCSSHRFPGREKRLHLYEDGEAHFL
jgi:hypothetical protein